MYAFLLFGAARLQKALAALLEAVEVVTAALLSPALRRYTRLAAKLGKIDKNPYSMTKMPTGCHSPTPQTSEQGPLASCAATGA